jgi:hypothetical protein
MRCQQQPHPWNADQQGDRIAITGS